MDIRKVIKLLEGYGAVEEPMQLSDASKTYWNQAGKYQKQMDQLWAELVPASGPSETLQGEVLRCASKIYYRHFNDGDSFTENSFYFLKRNIGNFKTYDQMVDKAITFAWNSRNKLIPNDVDSYKDLKIAKRDNDYDDDADEY